MKTYARGMLYALIMACSGMAQAEPPRQADTLSIWVNGLCGMCKNRIEDAALQTRGVASASWDPGSRLLQVTTDPRRFRVERLHYRVASAGHDTRELLAPDPVYASLPGCCKYREHNSHDEFLHGENEDAPLEEHGDGDGHDHGDIPGPARGTDKEPGDPPVVKGFVFETDDQGRRIPLQGATVYWINTTDGTITGGDGRFVIGLHEGAHLLIVSHVGFGNDSLHIHEPAEVEVGFSGGLQLDEVQVTHRIKPTSVSFTSAYHIRQVSEKELTKAACCNLSESFETNPSVDATFTDAVTGTRKIEMLGLAGPYVQVTRENMPDIRGLSSLTGLSYIPGTWIEGMQINTGAGSVVNGFEGITGQINVELRKPERADRLFLNGYGNSDGALEANLLTAYSMNERWHGSLLLHGNTRPFRMDHNGDGFLDHPSGNLLTALKRFKYKGDHGFESQLGLKVVHSDRTGGETGFDPGLSPGSQDAWGTGLKTTRLEAWTKAGKVFEDRPYSSMGFQVSGVLHRQDAFFGRTGYQAEQQSFYSNLIWQSILGNTNHQYRAGISFQADHYEETVGPDAYDRMELVPGAFLEYTFNYLDRFTAVAGARADYHNNYGAFFTPRLHLRYEPSERTVLRASAGRGQKTASIFAEHIGIFASSRSMFVEGTGEGKPYGLDPEVAWSFGINAAQGFRAGHGDAVFSLDYYYTTFENQVVVDLDRDPGEVHFYSLDGRSYSHSFQAQMDMEPVERFDIRLAYRFNDARTTYSGLLLPRPLTSRHRAFINVAYETGSAWNFDVTWQWQGSKRIPGTGSNPEPYRRETASPGFSLVNLQLGKRFFGKLELYAGVENLFDFVQEDPIIASDDPYGPFFDSSLIWGPVFGRKIYGGFRLRID